jgi:hypothetical protein
MNILSFADVAALSDEDLEKSLFAISFQGHRLLAAQLVHLSEIEHRRRDLESGCSSLYDYCTRRLGMSNGEAYRRITACRILRRFPIMLEPLARGEINLCAIALLRDVLTEDNVEDVLRRASNTSTRAVEELVAKLAPKPDVPSRIRALPHNAPSNGVMPFVANENQRPAPKKVQRVEPLSEQRHRIEFTASTALRKKIERIADLMRHANPKGDLEIIFDRAADLLLAELEKQRLGKTKRPRKSTGREDGVSQEVRRAVFERDGERCTFQSEDGERCPATTLLELDHIDPDAMGGPSTVENLRVRCRPHNKWYAEKTYGREHIEERIHFRCRKAQRVKVDDAQPMAIDLARRGLVNLGYRDAEAKRAVAIVRERHASELETLTPESVLREALAILVK